MQQRCSPVSLTSAAPPFSPGLHSDLSINLVHKGTYRVAEQVPAASDTASANLQSPEVAGPNLEAVTLCCSTPLALQLKPSACLHTRHCRLMSTQRQAQLSDAVGCTAVQMPTRCAP